MFTLGCNNLIAFIDHYPLHGFFSNRELSNISNPRICNLKEKTMKYHFKIRYNSGKWHHGLDACSQNPTQLNTFLKWYGGPQFTSTKFHSFLKDWGQFTSTKFHSFLKDWGLHQRNSSVSYPQSTKHAELAVKASKR